MRSPLIEGSADPAQQPDTPPLQNPHRLGLTGVTVAAGFALTMNSILGPQSSDLASLLLPLPNISSHSGSYSIHRWILSSSLAIRGTPPSKYTVVDFLPGLFMAHGTQKMASSPPFPVFMMKLLPRIRCNE
jgi:hypothetical protein